MQLHHRLVRILGRIRQDVATLLDKEAINTACRDEKYSWKDRLLNPTNAMHSFVLQILNENTLNDLPAEAVNPSLVRPSAKHASGFLASLKRLLRRLADTLLPHRLLSRRERAPAGSIRASGFPFPLENSVRRVFPSTASNGPSMATFDDVPRFKCRPHTPHDPCYTLPQLSLPGIRDPEGITRSRAFRFNVARLPATPTRPSRGPWLAIGLCCPDGSSLTTASSETLNPPRRLWIRGGGCCTQGNRLGVGIQRFPIYSAGLGSRAASLTPVPRRVQMTVASSSVLAFTSELRVRRSHWSFRGCRVHSELTSRSCYGPRAG